MSIYSNHDAKTELAISRLGLAPSSVNLKRYSTSTIKLITNGQYQLALDQLKDCSADVDVRNIKAVLLMRLGRPNEAVNLLRPIVFDPTSLMVKPGVPEIVILNFATSLLLAGHVSGCLDVLSSIQDNSIKGVRRLQACVRKWEKSLSFWSWIDWKVCGIEHISGDFPLDHLPGVFDWEFESENRLSLAQPVETASTSSHNLAV